MEESEAFLLSSKCKMSLSLEKEIVVTLIPLKIIHIGNFPNWRILGTNLNLSKPNEEPLLLSSSNPFHMVTKKIWQEVMQLKEIIMNQMGIQMELKGGRSEISLIKVLSLMKIW